MDLDTYLSDRKRKRHYIHVMFEIIAPGYDAFTRFFSFGMDKKWKQLLLQEAEKRTPKHAFILDLACGTGDLGIELARQTGASRAIGLDLSVLMLAQARDRSARERVAFRIGACDMLQLCIAESSVDIVTIGYGLRNVADVSLALREVARVLKPQGVVAILDFNLPVGKIWREVFLWYMWNAGRFFGWLWHREPITYGYIAQSIRRYFTIPEFEKQLQDAGFRVEWRASRLGGAIGIHIVSRKASAVRNAA
jgi:demethylmenaquinone methyltransferase/2-methoxy-6-polyprenyl-1,4-benzoquinol methylase